MLQTGIQSCEVLNRRIVFRGEERMSGRPHYQFVARYMFVFLVVAAITASRSEEHTSELQSHSDIVCRLLLEKKKGFADARRLLAAPVIAAGITAAYALVQV